MQKSGQVSLIRNGNECDVEWQLDFPSLLEKDEVCYCYWCPSFTFERERWYMEMYPNRRQYLQSSGYIDLCLRGRSFIDPPMKVEVSFSFKTLNGRKQFKSQFTRVLQGSSSIYQFKRFLRRLDFERRRSEFISPSGLLTVVCTLKRLDSAGSTNGISKPVCSFAEKRFNAAISLHKEKSRVRCPDCSDIVLYEKWHDHECQTLGFEDESFLCEDLKEMLVNGINHDLILKVADKELRAHRDVLRARSPVFKSMLTHDMVENITGVIDIPDCDPAAMEQFLCYLYTGKVDSLKKSNMLTLYYITDKYDIKLLKRRCCDFIKKSLSVTNICEVIQLALKHTDSGLLEHATEYFMDNVLDIIPTVEWESFMKDNSTVANKLATKSFLKSKKCKYLNLTEILLG